MISPTVTLGMAELNLHQKFSGVFKDDFSIQEFGTDDLRQNFQLVILRNRDWKGGGRAGMRYTSRFPQRLCCAPTQVFPAKSEADLLTSLCPLSRNDRARS